MDLHCKLYNLLWRPLTPQESRIQILRQNKLLRLQSLHQGKQ